jgi:hypothetical protein
MLYEDLGLQPGEEGLTNREAHATGDLSGKMPNYGAALWSGIKKAFQGGGEAVASGEQAMGLPKVPGKPATMPGHIGRRDSDREKNKKFAGGMPAAPSYTPPAAPVNTNPFARDPQKAGPLVPRAKLQKMKQANLYDPNSRKDINRALKSRQITPAQWKKARRKLANQNRKRGGGSEPVTTPAQRLGVPESELPGALAQNAPGMGNVGYADALNYQTKKYQDQSTRAKIRSARADHAFQNSDMPPKKREADFESKMTRIMGPRDPAVGTPEHAAWIKKLQGSGQRQRKVNESLARQIERYIYENLRG